MVKVKICGITNLKDALVSIDAGCDALGFVFYKKSPRYISPEQAKKIIQKLPKNIIKVGVFVNEKEEKIKATARLCKLDMLQFHGRESPVFCDKFKDYKIIKAFRVRENINLPNISRYKTFAYLFDAYLPGKMGGTGKTADWRLLTKVRSLKKPVFLSGGLAADNVKEAISKVKPSWVDVSSSLEVRPGKKDEIKIREFAACLEK